MLSEALAFPRADDDWLKTVLIGGVLSLLGFLIIPTIIVNGYLLRVLRAGVEGDVQPPKFEDWGDLLVDGILLWVVQFVYIGVPTFLLFIVAGSFAVVAAVGTSAAAGESAGAMAGGIVALVLGGSVMLLLLLASYLLPAAIANFARTGEVTAAFHLRTIAAAAFSADYFLAVVLVIAVSLVLGLIGGLLTIILVGIFVLFYLQMVVYHLFGQGFAAGLELDQSAAPSAESAG